MRNPIWRVIALATTVLVLSSGQAEAGEVRGTLRVTARVVERCTFATRAPGRWTEHLPPRDLVELSCGRNRPANITVAPFRPPQAVHIEREASGRHLQVTITY